MRLMPAGEKRAHPLELRAQAVAAVLAGGMIADVARRYGVPKPTVWRWVEAARNPPARRERTTVLDPMLLESRIFELVDQHAVTMVAQIQAVARPEWMARQTAGEVAALLASERDALIRLLSGFRPVELPASADNDAAPIAELGPGPGES
jgi:transposase-like protein